jgi:hypothetical protein
MNAMDDIYARFEGRRGKALRALRKMVLDVAQQTGGVGRVEECLKWGQASFVTVRPKSGSTVRLGEIGETGDEYALYFICNTNLVERFRERYPDTFRYQGNRAILLDAKEPVAEAELRHCIAMALTYHLDKCAGS